MRTPAVDFGPMLNLECPNCRKPHRVDGAFRGGVARCDSCGALIHVPTKDGRPIEAHTGHKRRPKAPGVIPGPESDNQASRKAPGAGRRRRLPGKPVAVTLAVLILTISAAAAWVIYQTALRARGGG